MKLRLPKKKSTSLKEIKKDVDDIKSKVDQILVKLDEAESRCGKNTK